MADALSAQAAVTSLYKMKRHLSADDLPLAASHLLLSPVQVRRNVPFLSTMDYPQQRQRWGSLLPGLPRDKTTDEILSKGVFSTLKTLCADNPMILVMLLLEISGWTALHCMSFYWTLWLGLEIELEGTGLRLSFVSLAVQAVAMVSVAACMPVLNQLFGPLLVFLFGHALVVACLVLTKVWVGPVAVLALSFGLGTSMVVHINNALTICEHMVDNAKLRGTVMAVVNSTMPIGQILTALVSGPVIDYLRGDVAACFVWIAVTHGLVLLVGTLLLILDHCLRKS